MGRLTLFALTAGESDS